MKFGTEYQEALKREEYPSQWIDSAISYKKLKKCIKRVREELLSLGLDHETLESLWQHVGAGAYTDSQAANGERMLHYQFAAETGPRFVPKLTIALDPHDGSPMDAWLSPETRRILQKIGRRQDRQRRGSLEPNGTDHDELSKVDSVSASPTASATPSQRSESAEGSPSREDHEHGQTASQNAGTETGTIVEPEIETVEIPLTSDSEFFQILRRELQALERLENSEQSEITSSIETLSKDLQVLKQSKSKFARAEIDVWREIFRLYIESDIFMSNHEFDAGVRPADKAAERLRSYMKQLSSVNTNPPKPKSKEAHIALDRFLNINTTLLRLLKFQELNRLALAKILKKFDKQTSLHAVSQVPAQKFVRLFNTNRAAVSPHDLARATAFAISQNLLSLIPQLDDYLCPICSWITYRPVRLRCGHVFCIRCMIRMQQDSKDECPLCRERVVLEATEENLDHQLKKFLKTEFAQEVAAKKKDNELQAGRELFGDGYEGTHKCVIM